jgi:hypothetical protein
LVLLTRAIVVDNDRKRIVVAAAVVTLLVLGAGIVAIAVMGDGDGDRAAVTEMAYRHKSLGELETLRHLGEQMIASGTMSEDQLRRQRKELEQLDAIISEKLAEQGSATP